MTITHVGAIAPSDQTVRLSRDELADWQQLLMVRGVAGDHELWVNPQATRLVYVFAPTDGSWAAIQRWLHSRAEYRVWVIPPAHIEPTIFGAMQWTLQQAAEQVEAERS